MSDLISREDLKKAFHERIYYFNKSSWDEANAIIDDAPTVPMPDFKEGYKQAIIDGKTNFSRSTVEPEEISKIKEITERALRSEDPINLYKAQALVEISKILGADSGDRIEAPDNDSEQITFDDILKEG